MRGQLFPALGDGLKRFPDLRVEGPAGVVPGFFGSGEVLGNAILSRGFDRPHACISLSRAPATPASYRFTMRLAKFPIST